MLWQKNDEVNFEYEFSPEEPENLEQRRLERINGESKTYGWKEAKEIITGKKNME